MKYYLYVLLPLLVVGCSSPKKKSLSEEWKEMPLAHAKRFHLYQSESQWKIEISVDDSTQSVSEFVFPKQLEKQLDNVVILSSSHVGYIDLLGEINSVKAIEKIGYLYNQNIRDRYHNDEVIALGEDGSLSVEKVIALQPDFISMSGGYGVSREIEKIKKAGITVIPMLDWREEHPLGRAEWVKVFGCVYGKYQLADSLFSEISERYIETKKEAETEGNSSFMFGYNYKGTWFLPGGKSYLSKLVLDAGGKYIYSNTDQSGSLQYSMESVMKSLLDADVWLSPGANRSKSEMLAMDKKYGYFQSFKNNRVYNYTKRQLTDGGNDYWETSPANPDLVLKDLFIINTNGPDSLLYYFERLGE